MTSQIRTPWPRLVVMGVSGAGKSTIASALAAELGLAFVDADDLHPESNIRKMRSGTPLDDADRWPWLEDVGRTLAAAPRPGAVTACSALRRPYRDVIRRFAPEAFFIHLDAGLDLISERIAGRNSHFMPASLAASQLYALEPLGGDEAGFTIDASLATERIVHDVKRALERFEDSNSIRDTVCANPVSE